MIIARQIRRLAVPRTNGHQWVMTIGGEALVMTDLLARLKDVCRSVDGGTARCPAHSHLRLSLHHTHGRWLLKCRGGWRTAGVTS
jgi:hypothetical protein